MLSHKILIRQDISRVANYYEDSADDYYAKDGKSIIWQGKGADLLNLTNQTFNSKTFKQLLNGEVDTNNLRRATRRDSKSRLAIDFTFSAPKSVSIQGLVCLDERVIAAHDRAVSATLTIAERSAQTRHKKESKSYVEDTGNLIIAKFRHETSRTQDPQLHTHAVIMNLTNRQDGQWRALKNDNIIKMTKYLGAVYNNELATALREIGYAIREERNGNFELAHIDREQINKFSKRSFEIEQKLSQQGLNRMTASTMQKQQITMQTRKAKIISENRQTLMHNWRVQAKELNIDFNYNKYKAIKTRSLCDENMLQQQTKIAKLAVKYAINHLTERQSIITRSILLDTAIKQSVGTVAKINDIEQEIIRLIKEGQLIQEDKQYYSTEYENNKKSLKNIETLIDESVIKGRSRKQAYKEVMELIKEGYLIAEEPRYTTPQAITYEQLILQTEQSSRATLSPIICESQVAAALQNTSLNAGQQTAVALMLSSCNRIVGVQGLAGTGKSHMLKSAKQLIEQNGYNICTVASYSSQVKELSKLGVQAVTLASFLHSKGKNINSKTVLIIDEAGVVPAQQLAAAVAIVSKADSRLVLIGDIAQTKAIEAGRPFHQLQVNGMATAQMDQIRRQHNAKLKKAVELAATGKTVNSLKNISKIVEIKDAQQRWQRIAADYTNLESELRAETIIITGTNEAKNMLNNLVRNNLDFVGKGVKCHMLIRRDNTVEQLKYAKNYQIGDIIKPERDYNKSKLKNNELYIVVGKSNDNKLNVSKLTDIINQNNIYINNETIEFSPMLHRKLSVYQAVENELSVGDIVKVTRKNQDLNVTTGQRFTITAVSNSEITFTSSDQQMTLPVNKPMYIDYAYASTVHSSQGMSCDKTLFDIDTKSITIAKDIYYVGISRAKDSTIIYTNNRSQLGNSISRENIKDAALDIKSYNYNSKNIKEMHFKR